MRSEQVDLHVSHEHLLGFLSDFGADVLLDFDGGSENSSSVFDTVWSAYFMPIKRSIASNLIAVDSMAAYCSSTSTLTPVT